MGWDDFFRFMSRAVGRPAARQALKGFIQELARDTTWEEAQELMRDGRGWVEVNPEAQEKLRNLFSRFPGLIEGITFEKILSWIEQANPQLLDRALRDPKGALWLRRNFDLARTAFLEPDEGLVLEKAPGP